VSKVDLRLQCGMPCSKLEVSTLQHGTLSGAGYLHQSPGKSTPRFSPAATKGAALIKMKAVTAGRAVLLFFQVWVTPRMTMMSPCFTVTTCPQSNSDIDLASAPW
jgi:hypothetical protein